MKSKIIAMGVLGLLTLGIISHSGSGKVSCPLKSALKDTKAKTVQTK